MTQIRMAQVGTKHGHATGKLVAMQNNNTVEVAGVFEPDIDRRNELQHSDTPFRGVHWFDSLDEMLGDPTIVAIASEGANHESLAQTAAIIHAGKHAWYDKPAGEDWAQWQQVVAQAQEQQLTIQMGYMFRYHDGFRRIAKWARSGFLGDVFAVRAHMSTSLGIAQREAVSRHQGGIFFDLAGHVLDQVVWLLGRPQSVTSFFHNHTGIVPACMDNTLAVFEFDKALAFIDIAAMEPKPMARRFEVYGTQGSAILIEPFEPGTTIRLCLDEARDGFAEGNQFVPLQAESRQRLYELALDSFLATISGQQPPDRSYEHELLVQETLLRATGRI